MSLGEKILEAFLLIATCIKHKKERNKKRLLKRDIQDFAEAAASGDIDTLSRMLSDLKGEGHG